MKPIKTETTEAASVPPPAKLVYTPSQVKALLGIGKNQVYEAMKSGDIPTITINGRRLIPKAAFDRKLAVGN